MNFTGLPPPPALISCSSSSLEEIGKRSQALLEKKKVAGFLDKSKDAQEVVNLIEQLRTAIVYYQVSRMRTMQTVIDMHGIVLTATDDLQSGWETGCKGAH